MKIIAKLILSLTLLFFSIPHVKAQSNDCLFKNPLCFYNSDILTYLQVLHKNQQYEQMLPYLSGPEIDGLSKTQKVSKLENASFGYQMKRAGVKEISKSEWNLTYSRTILGTQETFKIRCVTHNNLCTVYLDQQAWRMVFR
jgi:hypothetical protein